MKQLIQKLTDTFSPSGYEDAIRDVIRTEIKEFADEIRVDASGQSHCAQRQGRYTCHGRRAHG